MARVKKSEGESVGGYFRKIFEEDTDLLKSKSNSIIKDRWLADHSGYNDVPKSVMQNMANVKSIMRKKLRIGKRGRKAMLAGDGVLLAKKIPSKSLESLEELIDNCLTMARNLDRTGLEIVIRSLRRARNEVVLIGGQ